ncbi:MAG TPA: hypothetical protein VFX12_05705 [Vicinamibacterales bacterium]|nr:hypothetical protein [Vicinamibacterales bacterium]
MMMRMVSLAAVLMMGSLTASPAIDVTGQWAVTITTGDGAITGTASLKQAGEHVTGHIGPRADPTIPIEGVLANNRLTLKTSPRPGRTAAFERCDLTVTGETMTGTIQGGDAGQGTIQFVRTH